MTEPQTSQSAPRGRAPRTHPEISFRALARRDFERLWIWLNDPDVARWYSSTRATPAAIRRKYAPRIDGRSATRVHVVKLGRRCAGLAQTYRISAYPELAAALGAEPGWAGLDYLIGVPELRGRGLAHAIIDAFVREIVAATTGIDACVALPAHDNVRSIRALRRAGFEPLRRVEVEPGQIDALMLRRLVPDNAQTAGAD